MSQIQPQEQVSHPQGLAQQRAFDDEIDLTELFAKVWSRKGWVVAITALITLIALAYVLLTKPVYQAEVFLMPPNSSDLQVLNINTDELVHKVSPDVAYRQVLDQLRSKQQLQKFIVTTDYAQAYRSSSEQSDQQVFDVFSKALRVNKPKKGELMFTSISLEGANAERVAETLSSYVAHVQNKVVLDLWNDIAEARDRKLDQLQNKIDTKRKLAKTQRQDRIALIEEAVVIASAAGIQSIGVNAKNQLDGKNINIVNTDSLFIRGADALGAEITVLKARISDDPFIRGLRQLQERMANLKAIKINTRAVKPMRIDFNAVVPEKPIKPKKRLIVAVALLLGCMLGMFVALVVPARKEEGAD